MDSGKNGQNHGHHVKEHLSINKSRGDYFFKNFSFFWDSIWDMLLLGIRLSVVGKSSWKNREVGKSIMKLERMKLKSSV